MRIWLILAALLMTGMAGCADEAVQQTQDDGISEEFQEEFQAKGDKGSILGVVVDQAIVPLEGAKVRLLQTGTETVTNENGEFGFKDLEPGAYFIEVSLKSYTTVQSSTTVEAGVTPKPIRVALEFDPGSVPFWETLVFDGFIQCSTVTIALSLAVCSLPGIAGVPTDDEFIQYVPTQGDPTAVQVEARWDSTQPLGQNLRLQNFGGSASLHGPSPLVIRENEEYWAGGANRATDDGQMAWRVFAGWVDGTDPAGLWGVGVVVEQRFEMYTSSFYKTQPDEGWTFIEDGLWQE